MKAHILYSNDNPARSMERRKSLGNSGFIEERDPDATSQGFTEGLHDVQSLFFLQWFADWKRRAYESKNDRPPPHLRRP